MNDEILLLDCCKAVTAIVAHTFWKTWIEGREFQIRTLNREWRGFDKPTNVLSFPAANTRDAGSLGDVIIAFQTVAREAKEEGKPIKHHLAHLAVHGFLHLLGYDHETDRDARKMERLEVKILKGLGVPDPYADQDSGR